jgi:hypothetical protein
MKRRKIGNHQEIRGTDGQHTRSGNHIHIYTGKKIKHARRNGFHSVGRTHTANPAKKQLAEHDDDIYMIDAMPMPAGTS